MNSKLKQHGLSILTCLIWSSAFPVTRIAGESMAPGAIALLRCISALFVLLLIWALRRDRKLPEKKDILYFIASGVTGFGLYLILFTAGLKTVTSAESSVIIALTPVIVAVLASVIFKESVSLTGWLAIAGSFAGVVILMLWGSGLQIRPGMLFTLAASILFAIYNLISRKLSAKGYDSIDIVTFSMVSAVILLMYYLPETIESVHTASPAAILMTVFLGVFPSALAYVTWGKALSLAGKASEVTNYMFVTPLFATCLGIILLGEVPTAGTYLGGTLIIVMAFLFTVAEKK